MTGDLCMPVEVRGVATVREADGLAMSSRNAYLTSDERARAPRLYQALLRAAERLRQGAAAAEAERLGAAELDAEGMECDYFSVRRAQDLGPPSALDRDLVVLAAARLGRARLIDNLRVGGDRV
jgi:pantoate--beta-alanine ligase